MPITIRDEAAAAELSAATEPQEVRTPDGRLLGQFTPAPTPKMSFPEFGVTDSDAKGYTPEEVMAFLRGIDRGLRG